MQNIDVRFNATTSNFGKVKKELGEVTAQAQALSDTLSSQAFAKNPAVLDPVAWRRSARDVAAMSSAFRDAASQSGLLTTQQLRQTSQAERMTKQLRDQKLSFSQMRKDSQIMREVYRDQLRMRRMMINNVGTDSLGRTVTDIAVPKNVPRDLDTARMKMGLFGAMAESAGHQMVNLGKNVQWAGRQLTVGFSYPIAMFGALAGTLAFKVEDAFAKINKVYDVSEKSLNDAVAKETELFQLREKSMDNARQIAERYGIAVEKTLAVQQELAATGMTLDTGLLEATREVQRISALGDIDPEQTTDMVVALQTAFKIGQKEGTNLTRTLNFMNAASAATSLSLQDIAEATPRAASGMAAVGATAEDMTILLVSMREAGINAAEGANALKSAGSRLLNKAITNKASEIYKSYGADIDVSMLSEQAGGNLAKFMELLGKQLNLNDQLTAKQRASAVAALFGTYQYNRLTAALTNTADAYASYETTVDGTVNQTRKAMDLMGASTEELEKRAAEAEKSMMDNAAGRFKQAVATVKAELAEMGGPFLDVATKILGFLGNLAQGFNGLGDGTKTFVMFSAGLMALAGPLIMLGGLAMNLFGHFAKGIGRITTLTTGFKVLTTEERAATLVAEAVTTAMKQQQVQTDTLRQEVVALAAAYDHATLAATRFSNGKPVTTTRIAQASSLQNQAAFSPMANGSASSALSAQTQRSLNQQYSSALGAYASRLAPASSTPSPLIMAGFKNTSGGREHQAQDLATVRSAQNVAQLKRQQNEERKLNAIREDGDRNRTKVQQALALRAEQENRAREKAVALEAKRADHATRVERTQAALNGGMGSFIGSLGIAAAGMGVLAVSSNETVDAAARYVMFAGMAAPLVTSLVTGTVAWAKSMWSVAAAAVAARTASAAGVARSVGLANGLKLAVKSLWAATGPVGAIVGALTVAGGVAYTLWQKNKKEAEAQRKLIEEQNAAADHLANSAKGVAESMGEAAGAYNSIANAEVEPGKTDERLGLERYNYYKNDESGIKDVSALTDANGELMEQGRLLSVLSARYIDLQVIGKRNKNQAAVEIQSMLAAAGMGAAEALALATKVQSAFGDVTNGMVDWGPAIDDQLNLIRTSVDGMLSEVDKSGGLGLYWYNVTEVTPEQKKAIENAVTKGVAVLDHALAAAMASGDVGEQNNLMSSFAEGSLQQWNDGWEKIKTKFDDPETGEAFKAIFREYGVNSGATFADAWRNNDSFKSTMEGLQGDFLGTQYKELVESVVASGSTFEETFITAWAEQSSQLGKDVTTARQAISELKLAGIGVDADEALTHLQSASDEYLRWISVQQQMEQFLLRGGDKNSAAYMDLENEYKELSSVVLAQVNIINNRLNFDPGKTAAEAISNLMNKTRTDAEGAADAGKDLANALIDGSQIDLDHEQSLNIARDAMKAVQQELADAESEAMEQRHDRERELMDETHDLAMENLDKELDAESEAFDKRWEKRRESLEKSYDKQIEANDKALEAERKADEVRQNLYEREKKRLDDLANRANKNIDFNSALDSGNMDEAAKILNEMRAVDTASLMDEEQRAAEEKTQKKEEATEAKNERLETQREAAMKRLETQEERMRKHMESNHEYRRKSIEQLQKAEVKSFEQRTASEKRSLEESHKMFMSYTAKSKADLKRWLKECGIEYSGFGEDLKGIGEGISGHLGERISAHVRNAGIALQDDEVWKQLGSKGGRKVIRGMGFKGYASFNKFLDEGLPGPSVEGRHEGGVIGVGGGSRKGVAPTYKGLHRSEKMVLAQKGEYMINRKASQQHRDVLDSINSGNFGTEKIGVGGGDGSMGPMPVVMGAAVSAMFRGIQKGFANAKEKAEGRAATAAMLKGISANGGIFGTEQLSNARVIADVGRGMGMSQRDILIGLMTAMQESSLKNINYGDRDSVGLFQQRPSQGWGTVEQIMDPRYASKKFFEGLKNIPGREVMSLTGAAQAVQRSAFPDAYAKWEDEARIMMDILSGKTSAGGAGGFFYPSDRGKGWRNPHDYANAIGSPLYAISDGKVIESRAVTGGGSPGNGLYKTPYSSYGETVVIQDANGNRFRYAHLDAGARYVQAGDVVRGGQMIGRSGNTGNSTGPHTHFDVNGNYDAKGYLQSIGVPLRTGGTIKYDNTIANLHRGETVLTAGLTKKFSENVASGGANEYNVNIDLRGAYIRDDVDIKKAVDMAIDAREAKVGRKRVVR